MFATIHLSAFSQVNSKKDISVEDFIQKYVQDSLTVPFFENIFGKAQVDLQTYFIKIKTDFYGKPKTVVVPYFSLSLLQSNALKKKFDSFITLSEKQSYNDYLEAGLDYVFAIHIYKPVDRKAQKRSMTPYIDDNIYFFEDGSRFIGPVMFTLIVNLESNQIIIDDSRHWNTYK